MKMAIKVVDDIGELAGVHPITSLINLIINAASTARRYNRVCRKFAQWLETIEGLLKPLLKIPKLMDHPETSKPLKQLEESLQQAYELVMKYKDRSYPYRFIMGSDIVERFRDAQNEIKDYIDLVPLIKLFVSETIHQVDICYQYNEEEEEEEEEDQNNGKNKEQMDKEKDGRGKDTERGKDGEKEGNDKVKEKGRDKGKDTENENEDERHKDTENSGKEKGRDKENDTEKERNKEKQKENGSEEDREKGKDEKYEKKNVLPIVETAVLEVGMHCECNGCRDGIERSIRKYPGVKNVAMEMDERILSVTVVGHFDAKVLRDYAAKNTKKEVDLVGNVRRERDDHQVLEKTGKDSKSIGEGGKLKGGNKNKKRVMPMIAETVVLKVSGTGLRCGCNGCVDKFCNRLKIIGVQQVDVDMDKSQVTVTGTSMDMAILVETLGKNVGRPVEVVRTSMMDDGKD